jgi:hypothetical protein
LDRRQLRLIEEGKIKPYVADEIFINLDGTGYSQNRLYLGVVTKFGKNTSTDFYYAFQIIKSDGTWENNGILGIDFTYYF